MKLNLGLCAAALALASCGKSSSPPSPTEPRPVESAPGVTPLRPTADHKIELVGGQLVDGKLVLFTEHTSDGNTWGEIHGFDGKRAVWSRRGVGLAGPSPIAIDRDAKTITVLDGSGKATRTVPLPAIPGDLAWARAGDRLYAIRTSDANVISFELGAAAAPVEVHHTGRFEVGHSTLIPNFAHALADGVWVPCNPDGGYHGLCRAPATGGAIGPILQAPVRDAAATADKLFVASNAGLTAYTSAGLQVWNVPPPKDHWITRVVASGPIVAVDSETGGKDDRTYRIAIHDAATGAERWHRDTSYGTELAAIDDRVAYRRTSGITVVDGNGKDLGTIPLESKVAVTTEFVGSFGEILHGDLVIAGRYLAVMRDSGLEIHEL